MPRRHTLEIVMRSNRTPVLFAFAFLLLFASCTQQDVVDPGGSTAAITDNVVDNIGPFGLTNTIHGIYTAGPNSVIENNIVTRASAAACIHTYRGSHRDIISNNTVANCGRHDIVVAADPGITTDDSTTVDNNILDVDSTTGYGFGIVEADTGIGIHSVYYNNIFYNTPPGNHINRGTESGSITLTSAQFNSLFVNYTGDRNGDYHLRSGAVAIDAGTTSCAVRSAHLESLPRHARAWTSACIQPRIVGCRGSQMPKCNAKSS